MEIPRILHRIWFGGPLPPELRAYGRSWEERHPGWEHVLWSEENLPPLHNQDLFDRAEEIAPRNVGQLRSDIARYELLQRLGGVYVDCDFECRLPLDDLLRGIKSFAAWEVSGRWINNAILGAVPGHPFLGALVEGLELSVERFRGHRPNRMSGPQYLTRIYRRHGGLTVFPKDWFYPYLYDELERGQERFPQAYAIHHWANKRNQAGVPCPA